MAWLQSPDGKKKVNVRSGSDAFWTHYKAGWTDVTKPSSERQTAHRKRWREGGEIHSTISKLKNLAQTNTLLSSTETDRIYDLIETLEYRLQRVKAEAQRNKDG